MQYTLGAAARHLGYSKSTLTRAVHAGKLSATRREDGSYVIDGAELLRAFPPRPSTTDVLTQETPGPAEGPHPLPPRLSSASRNGSATRCST